MQYLAKVARSKKIKGFTAEVLRDNLTMISLMHKGGVHPESTIVDGSYLFRLEF